MADDLHARIRAALTARLEVARAATSGPWTVVADQVTMVLHAPHPDWPGSPEDDVRRWGAALRMLERHAAFWSTLGEQGCSNCSDDAGDDPRAGLELWPCPDVRDLADMAGVDVGGPA